MGGSEESGKIFVGGLSWDTDQDSMQGYFSQFGEITDCIVMKDPRSGKSRGFGFVSFKDPSTVQVILSSKNHVIDGRTVDAKACNARGTTPKSNNKFGGGGMTGRTTKIFIGGLPNNVGEDTIKDHFSRFGNVTEVVIMYDHEKGRSRGFGFLTFDNEDSVEQAVAEHYVDVNGKQVECKKAEPRGAAGGGRGGGGMGRGGGRGGGNAGGYGGSPGGGWGQGGGQGNWNQGWGNQDGYNQQGWGGQQQGWGSQGGYNNGWQGPGGPQGMGGGPPQGMGGPPQGMGGPPQGMGGGPGMGGPQGPQGMGGPQGGGYGGYGQYGQQGGQGAQQSMNYGGGYGQYQQQAGGGGYGDSQQGGYGGQQGGYGSGQQGGYGGQQSQGQNQGMGGGYQQRQAPGNTGSGGGGRGSGSQNYHPYSR